MNITFILLAVLTTAAAYTDIRYRRIPNLLSLAGLVTGVSVHILLKGFAGIYWSVIGAAAGFGVMLLFHLFGALGAGDVKLFAAIGAMGGPWITLSAVTYSILFAGLIGVCFLAAKKQLVSKGTSIMNAVIGFVCLKRLDAVHSIGDKRDMLRFPFLLAVLPGMAAALWENWG